MKVPMNERALMEMLEMEKLHLQANILIGNDRECLMSEHRIADIKIALLILSGDLPLNIMPL